MDNNSSKSEYFARHQSLDFYYGAEKQERFRVPFLCAGVEEFWKYQVCRDCKPAPWFSASFLLILEGERQDRMAIPLT